MMAASDINEDLEAGMADLERQPLLAGANRSPNGYEGGARPSTSTTKDRESGNTDDEDSDEEAEKAFQKRVKDSGGFWAYIKGYSMFLPHLWPSKNRRMQCYLFLIGLCIAAQRVLNILIPRQEGIVVEKLVQNYATGELPWRELAWLFGFRFMNSPGTRGAAQDFLELLFDNWSRKQMTDLIFSHIMSLSMDFHANADSGELMKSIEQGSSLTRLVRLLLFEFAPIILDLVTAVFYVSSLFDISFAGIIVVMATSYGLITWRGGIWEARKRRVFARMERNATKAQYESIGNWTTVSYFNRTEYQHRQLMSSLHDMLAALTRLRLTDLSVEAARTHILFLGQMSVNFLAGYHIVRGVKPIGNFIALNSIWGLLTEPLYVFSYISEEITSYIVDAEAVLEILRRKPTVAESPNARPLTVERGEVRFENVSFAYGDRKETIKDISFVAQPGQTVALVGETGAGKSTILKLLFRLYDAAAGGRITIDGVDIRDATLGSLREAFGIVPQETSLFNASIMENVRYARLGARDGEVAEACAQARIHEKIMSFPDQYATLVGERGVKLSGGERQRISIARVILKQPKLLFLDEASSAIDSKTESDIQPALRRLSAGRTTFVIAHRLSTIVHADVILVLDDGQIVESGSHSDLIEKGGKYGELWEIQTGRPSNGVAEI